MFKVADPSSTILVELTTQGKARIVAFRPDEERALMVGSDIRADFRVSGTGAAAGAAIQFHLERRAEVAWLVPAYGAADMRVNTARVTGPLPLEERNVIEFAGARIDIVVIEEGNRNSVAEGSATRVDAWELDTPRSWEPPGDTDTTLVAMHAVVRPANSLGQQTTAMHRPPDLPRLAPQQTERIAPYRPQSKPSAVPMPVPAQSTERMSPIRNWVNDQGPTGTERMSPHRHRPNEDPDAAPPTVRTTKRVTGAVASVPLGSPPIVPVPVVAVTFPAVARPEMSAPLADQASDTNTTLFETPALRTEQAFAADAADDRRAVSGDLGSPTLPAWASDETPRAGAKTRTGVARLHSWLERLGLLAKARPVLVACGVVAGGCVLTGTVVVATGVTGHREPRAQRAAALAAPLSNSAPRAIAPAVLGLTEPIQIIAISAAISANTASRVAVRLHSRKTPSDPELAAAVAYMIAGRYSEARAAYAALSQRADNAATYATTARLLARAEDTECSAAPKNCPGVHR